MSNGRRRSPLPGVSVRARMHSPDPPKNQLTVAPGCVLIQSEMAKKLPPEPPPRSARPHRSHPAHGADPNRDDLGSCDPKAGNSRPRLPHQTEGSKTRKEREKGKK